jgi:hypothetical protein
MRPLFSAEGVTDISTRMSAGPVWFQMKVIVDGICE